MSQWTVDCVDLWIVAVTCCYELEAFDNRTCENIKKSGNRSSQICEILQNHPLLTVQSRLFKAFAATLYGWRASLHQQPEDAPCCGDKGPSQHANPYRTTFNIIVQCILICMFLDCRQENKRFWTEQYQAIPEFNLLLLSSWISSTMTLQKMPKKPLLAKG
jgi:hypothetical protein